MSGYKSIMVPCYDETMVENALAAARSVGARFDALTVAYHVTPPPTVAAPAIYPPDSGAYAQNVIDAVKSANDAKCVALESAVVGACQKAGVPCESDVSAISSGVMWKTVAGLVPKNYVEEARVSDLVVGVRRSGEPSQEGLDIFSEVITGSGQPVLIFPDGESLPDEFQIVVAWDGGQGAARAVNGALPLLKSAKSVHIATVSNDTVRQPDAERLSERLKRHGIAATTNVLEGGTKAPEDVLQEFATRQGASLMVMGAYSHSRLRDLVLGGVTRSVIRNVTLPVLLAH